MGVAVHGLRPAEILNVGQDSLLWLAYLPQAAITAQAPSTWTAVRQTRRPRRVVVGPWQPVLVLAQRGQGLYLQSVHPAVAADGAGVHQPQAHHIGGGGNGGVATFNACHGGLRDAELLRPLCLGFSARLARCDDTLCDLFDLRKDKGGKSAGQVFWRGMARMVERFALRFCKSMDIFRAAIQ